MPFRFNIFAPYLFLVHKVTIYCPPINHGKFRREFEDRYSREGEPTEEIGSAWPSERTECSLLELIFHPIKTYKLIRDYHMISNLNIILQVVYILTLVRIFSRAVLNLALTGSSKGRTRMSLGKAYYPQLASVYSLPFLFNLLVCGRTFLNFIGRCIQFKNIIRNSLKNANGYKSLMVTQVNSAYLASFHLSFNEWISLFKFSSIHESRDHSNKEIQMKHLALNNEIQQILPKLSNNDALFYVNSIDFDECYTNSVLPGYIERTKRYKNWHLPYPASRLSSIDLAEIILVAPLGTLLMFIIHIMASCLIIYMELKMEFPANYSPSMRELLQALPSHFSNYSNLARTSEFSMIFTASVLKIYDASCIVTDAHIIKSRAHKMTQIFANHSEFCRNQTGTNFPDLSLKRCLELQFNERNHNDLKYAARLDKKHSLSRYSEFNRRIGCDSFSVRLVHEEFVNAKNHHTEFFNFLVLGGGVAGAYLIPILMLHPHSAMTYILLSALSLETIPIFFVLFYCTRLEREVMFHLLLDFYLQDERENHYLILISSNINSY